MMSCNVFTGDMSEVAVGDFDGDGKKDIALRPYLATAVWVFGLDGKLKYSEQFGEGAFDHGSVKRGKKDHLIVQTETRLLAYP